MVSIEHKRTIRDGYFSQLVLVASEDFSDRDASSLLSELWHKTAVAMTVHVSGLSRPFFVPWNKILRAIGLSSKVRSLHLQGNESARRNRKGNSQMYPSLSFDHLADYLRLAQLTLEELSVDGISICPPKVKMWDEIQTSFRSMNDLRRLVLTNVHIIGVDWHFPSRLVESMSNIRCLEHLLIHASEKSRIVLTLATLNKLLSHQSIYELDLAHVTLWGEGNPHTLALHIQTNSALTVACLHNVIIASHGGSFFEGLGFLRLAELKLKQCRLPTWEACGIAKLLSGSSTLKGVVLSSTEFGANKTQHHESVQLIIASLGKNCTVETLEWDGLLQYTHMDEWEADHGAVISPANKNNNQGQTLASAVLQSLKASLRTNSSLKRLSMKTDLNRLQEETKSLYFQALFSVGLNRCNYRKIIASVNYRMEDWVNSLCQVCDDDLGCQFHLLLENPTLCKMLRRKQ